MIKTLRNLFKQDKEKFVVPKSVQAVNPLRQSGRTAFSLWARTSMQRPLSLRI